MGLTNSEKLRLSMPAPKPTKQEALAGASRRLREIVEGQRSHRWISDETGGRLKDTPEWCEFYSALAALDR